MNKKYNFSSSLKKILGILFVSLVAIGTAVGIGFSSVNIANKTNLSSDFDKGLGYTLRFDLVDEKNQPLYTQSSDKKSYTLNNEKEVLSNLNNIADILAKELSDLGLTNITVQSGIGSYVYQINNNDSVIPVGYVNMVFESSPVVFGITDTESDQFLNYSKIASKFNSSNRYEFESVQKNYSPYSLTKNLPSTGRNGTSIIASEPDDNNPQGKPTKDSVSSFAVNDPKNLTEKITTYKNYEGTEDTNSAQLVQPNYYYLKPFIDQKFDYDKLSDEINSSSTTTFASSSSSDSNSNSSSDSSSDSSGNDSSDSTATTPDPLKQYETNETWLLWNNKAGFINYLNKLVICSYYNIYANNLWNVKFSSNNFEVGSSNNNTNINALDTSLVKKINTYLDSLSDIDKSIIKFLTVTTSGEPKFIDESNLMGFLWEFYNSEFNTNNSVGIYNSLTSPIDSNIHCDNEINGWGFLESDNSDLSSLLSTYLVAKYDYTNFTNFFENPSPPSEDEVDNTKPLYYTTSKFKLSNQESSLNSFINTIQNKRYNYPILDKTNDFILNNIESAKKKIVDVENKITNDYYGKGKDWLQNEEYLKDVEQIAKSFNYEQLFGNVSVTRQKFASPAFYNFPIFNILMIVIATIILLVGIFVSIRYRIPGFISSLFSGLVFAGSLAFFNIFGYTFSFFSFMGLIFGVMLSFITPFYVFKNFRKEISQGSSIYGAYIKTMKKYWKLALDIHVISLLCSFSFLFFGSYQLVDFGVVLTISTFLSFIFSGILFFITLSIIIWAFKIPNFKFFMNMKLFLLMKSFSENFNDLFNGNELNDYLKLNNNSLFNNFNFFSKKRLFVNIFFIVAAIIGLILLFVLKPGYSTDFFAGYLLKIYNADLLNNISYNSIPGYLGQGAYLFQDVLYVPVSSIDNDATIAWIKGLNLTTDAQNTILKSYSLTINSDLISNETIKNGFICFGVSIGFVSCWVLISINWIAIFPTIITQLVMILFILGWIGITRSAFNVNDISSILLLYVISTVTTVGILSSIKISWDRKKPLSFSELKVLTNSIVSRVYSNYLNIFFILILFSVLASVLTANFLIAFSFIILVIGLVILMLTLPYILLPTWHQFIVFRNIYVKELTKSALSKNKKIKLDYDLIDEQRVKGLNY